MKYRCIIISILDVESDSKEDAKECIDLVMSLENDPSHLTTWRNSSGTAREVSMRSAGVFNIKKEGAR